MLTLRSVVTSASVSFACVAVGGSSGTASAVPFRLPTVAIAASDRGRRASGMTTPGCDSVEVLETPCTSNTHSQGLTVLHEEEGLGEAGEGRPQAKGSSAPQRPRSAGRCARAGPVVAGPPRCGLTAGPWGARDGEREVGGVPGGGSAGSSGVLPGGASWGRGVAGGGEGTGDWEVCGSRGSAQGPRHFGPQSHNSTQGGEGPLYWYFKLFL